MNLKSFKEEMNNYLKEINISLNIEQLQSFYNYMNLLIEKNKVMNLTGITEPKEVILKHFVDSLTVAKYIEDNNSIIDIGTGAGFPGIPLKINNNTLKLCLLDSLNKRIGFLDDVIKKNNIKDAITIHGRAEEYGQDNSYRENFDIAVARAVAPLNVLLEYMLPFVKLNGKCICMKGNITKEEIQLSKKALELLGGKIEIVDEFKLPKSDNNRTVIIVNKTKHTNSLYPRKPGTPSKKPL